MISCDAAQQILQDSVTRYAELVSYADEGTLSRQINPQDPGLFRTDAAAVAGPPVQ